MLRRNFLSGSALALGAAIPGVGSTANIPAAKSILDYGAIPDGKTLCTPAIQRAIDAVAQAGGGLVYAPPGKFLIAGLELKSRVTLYLEAGCTLLGSTSIADYKYFPGPSLWGDANGHHLIFARDADDVTLCGLGTLDGQGAAYWTRLSHPAYTPEELFTKANIDFYPTDNHRPSPMLEFVGCRNLRISGVTITGAAGWTLRPVNCETVVIDGIRIRNFVFGPNTDGLDITCCTNVFVSNCDIATGDDAICIKSESPYGGPVLPTRNITITNCVLTTSCNGLKMGTATRGAFENIVFSNSVLYSEPTSPVNGRIIGGINVEMVDGGSVDGVVISNIRMQNVRCPIFVKLAHRTPHEGTFLRNVLIEGIDATGADITSNITGVPGALRPTDITVSNCRIRTIAAGKPEWINLTPPERAADYPESREMGHTPAYGFYIRHADRVHLRDIEIITDKPDARSAIVCDDVEHLTLRGLDLSAPVGGAPVIDLRGTRRAFLSGTRAPAGAAVLAQVSGAGSSGLALSGNHVDQGQQEVVYSNGATAASAKSV
jgi:polygalacturonase